MSQPEPEQVEAVQAVVDRVTSWQDGAPEATVEAELRAGLTKAGVDLPDEAVSALAEAIEGEHGAVDAQKVLASRWG